MHGQQNIKITLKSQNRYLDDYTEAFQTVRSDTTRRQSTLSSKYFWTYKMK